MVLQLLFVLTAIIIGARLGGIGLGVMGGVGLGILTFVFGLQPTAPPQPQLLLAALAQPPLFPQLPACRRPADLITW